MNHTKREKHPWKPQGSIMAEGLSTIGPIAYYPNLKLVFHNVTACVVFTYLETHHAAPQDDPRRVSSLPVTVNVDQICRDLQVTRRTLALALFPLCTLYPSEASRWSAARAAREFIQPNHSRLGRFKPYSIVSANKLAHSHELVLRRNVPLIRTIGQNAGMTQGFPHHLDPSPSSQQTEAQECCKMGVAQAALLRTPESLAEIPARVSQLGESLAEILMRASVLGGDRRKVRYPRLRKAVEAGLEDASILKAKQPKGKRRNTTLTKAVNEGVNPQLPEEIEGRLSNLRDGEKEGI